jgi:hypothetical protein
VLLADDVLPVRVQQCSAETSLEDNCSGKMGFAKDHDHVAEPSFSVNSFNHGVNGSSEQQGGRRKSAMNVG